ncbi:glutaminase A [Leptolyngbya sp. NK1-12]|uniref:glutaminase n=1 Tax=Leptolyngbya sp. NK1-12 TaxID=2547451 RepID=A0AA96WI32_9CYAN|nr:glutaminase A [Leptolyngbya sp. NK1-12]
MPPLTSLSATQLATYAQIAQAQAIKGKVIGRIDPLASANPNELAVYICSEHHSSSYGNTACRFPLMSVIKPFSLLFLLHHCGTDSVRQWVGMQPSDMPFNSLEQLRADQGFPRNPMINSGAIALADKLPGTTATERCTALCQWLNQQANVTLRLDATVLTAVRQSDRSANLALVDYLAACNVLHNPSLALDTYEQICCLSGQVADLVQLGQLLAGTAQPAQPLLPQHRQIVNAVMLTCGLYATSGRYAVEIGLPLKSGISGALLAVVPRQGAIACYSPALDDIGNPVAALALVQQLSQDLQLSVFS